jgi:hypothetical protein
MSRSHEQCPKCGTWREGGRELTTHIDICENARCMFCGHAVNPKTGHSCPGANYCMVRRVNGIWGTEEAHAHA